MAMYRRIWTVVVAVLAGRVVGGPAAVNTTTCNGKTYVYNELAGYGLVSSQARDKFGDTIGGIGSAIWLNQTAWTRGTDGVYEGEMWTVADRGWNTEGTLNFAPRVHVFSVTLTPAPKATVVSPSGPNVAFTYRDSILLCGPDGRPATGLDADSTGHVSYDGFPDLPVATYTGDGFGGGDAGHVTRSIAMDPEGLHVMADGSFWVSDEYGPYVYLFDAEGTMKTAIRPPDAVIPMRNGTQSFSANSAPHHVNNGTGDDVAPADGPTGRHNNHGFEGLTLTDNDTTLWVLLQAAANQEGGLSSQTERHARLLKYDVSKATSPCYAGAWVVALPLYTTAKKANKTAEQSEIYGLPNGQFFVLARDSGAGHGQKDSTSTYRHVDIFDVSSATDIKATGGFDCATCGVTDGGVTDGGALKDGVRPARYCPFLDFNVGAQLGRFGLHNGGGQDAALLNEKWESIGLVRVLDPDAGPNDWFLFSLSDNDFVTQQGTLQNGNYHYRDGSGYNLDSQALVFSVTLPP